MALNPLPTKPLNGEKTHPLSAHAIGVLRDLATVPRPRSEINPGVSDRLMREALANDVQLTSPFKAHKGGKTSFLQITEAGRQRLADIDSQVERQPKGS